MDQPLQPSTDETESRLRMLFEMCRILGDNLARTGRELAAELNAKGIAADKSLVNNILFREGRSYVNYDRATHSYSLKTKQSPPDPRVGTKPLAAGKVGKRTIDATHAGQSQHIKFSLGKQGSLAFFDMESRGSELDIELNADHPATRRLQQIFGGAMDTSDPQVLKVHLQQSRDFILQLIIAWAKYEDEQPDGPRRQKANDSRWEWGRALQRLMNGDE